MSQITEVVTDADYPALETPELKVVKHRLWPVSYMYKGVRYDDIRTYKPTSGEYVIGEEFIVETLHPVALPEDATTKARIAELKAELARLEGEA